MVRIEELSKPVLSARAAYKALQEIESSRPKQKVNKKIGSKGNKKKLLNKNENLHCKKSKHSQIGVNKQKIKALKITKETVNNKSSSLKKRKDSHGVTLNQKKNKVKENNSESMENEFLPPVKKTKKSPHINKVKKMKGIKPESLHMEISEFSSQNNNKVKENNSELIENEILPPFKRKKSPPINKMKKMKGIKPESLRMEISECSSQSNGVDPVVYTADDIVDRNSSPKKVKREKTKVKGLKKRKLPKWAAEKEPVKKMARVTQNCISNTNMKIKKTCINGKMLAQDSQELGLETFKWILSPVSVEEFFNTHWEQKLLLIKGVDENKFGGILSTSDIDKILRRNNLTFTKNIDVTSYKDGKRETLNPEGRALASLIWDFYNSGCSVRMLNPQTFHRPVWKILANLQEYFNSFCGANVYLTPPGTQGFAPHWDDIEAFILQLEGKKRWRVYKPRTPGETLPRESSGNFGPDDPLGAVELDCVLEPGDLLYFPRGFIHQGEALNDIHSLHITISTYQKNAWVDLLEKLLPATLAIAAEKDVEFRRGLPREYFNHLGIAFSDRKEKIQEEIFKKLKTLVGRMMSHAPINAAIDQMAKGFIHDSLPPVLNEEELKCSIFEGGEKWSIAQNSVVNRVELSPESSIRLIRRGCVRLVVEEDTVRLFHSIENSREYHAEEPNYIEIAPDIAPGVEALIHKYPEYMPVETLPLPTLEDKMQLAIGLWERGILTTFEELDNFDNDNNLLVSEINEK